MTNLGRIVVGVDGSPASVNALQWAARQAALTDTPVEAVSAWQNPVAYGGFPLAVGCDWRDRARRTLDSTVERALGDEAAAVSRRVVEGNPARVLTQIAGDAGLLVVGGRRRRRISRLVNGSVSETVATHADCPVLVVREAA